MRIRSTDGGRYQGAEPSDSPEALPKRRRTAHVPRGLMRLLFTAALGACLMGGCQCGGRDVAANDGPEIEKPALITQYPEKTPPAVDFPAHVRQEDVSLNKFVEQVLDICVRGDYDAYRQLFGSAYRPTRETQFKQVWEGVKDVRVLRIEKGPEADPRYYVLAEVHLREAKKGRVERSVPVMVFKEAGEWRVGPAPKKAIEALRALESRPASGPAPASAPSSRPITP